MQGRAIDYLAYLGLCFYQEAIAASKISPEAAATLRTATGIINFHAGRIVKSLLAKEIETPITDFTIFWMTDEDSCSLNDQDKLEGTLYDNLLSAFTDAPSFKEALKNKMLYIDEYGRLIQQMDKVFTWTLPALATTAINVIYDSLLRERGHSGHLFRIREPTDGTEIMFFCPQCGQPYPQKPSDERCEVCSYPASRFKLYPR